MPAAPESVRLAELVATMSLGTDLGLGQPMEHVIRQTLIALRMSEQLDFDESERAVVYYAGLLAWVGCHTDAYEQSKWFGDDIALKADVFTVDDPGPGTTLPAETGDPPGPGPPRHRGRRAGDHRVPAAPGRRLTPVAAADLRRPAAPPAAARSGCTAAGPASRPDT